MTIEIGTPLPAATFLKVGESDVETVASAALFGGRTVAFFGLPGAYTGTCSTLHVPSFMRVAPALRAKGVDEIVCMAVNDPFVMKIWGDTTGGIAAGITFLADAESAFTKAIGLQFTVQATGLINRCKRFSALVVDGVVTQLNIEEERGVCNLTAGETLLDQIA